MQCNFFVLPTLSHCLKNLSEKKISYLTCIVIEGTFPSTNQHPCTSNLFQNSSTQDALENVLARKKKLSHRLTLDENDSCPSRATVLYVQLRT